MKHQIHLIELFVYTCALLHVSGETDSVYERFERYSVQFSVDLRRTFEKSFGHSKLQTLVNNADNYVDVSKEVLAENAYNAVESKLHQVIRVLLLNKDEIEARQGQERYVETKKCCQDDIYGLEFYDEKFKGTVNKNITCSITENTINSYVTNELRNIYQNNLLTASALTWQYFGSTHGSYHQYPSSSNICQQNGDKFDPRLRSWYVSAAMSTRRNIIVVIDQSGSMYNYDRMSIAKAAALTVMDTLNSEDYVTVVAFSTQVKYPPGCFGNTLAKATNSNLDILRKWIRKLRPLSRGRTRYSSAFTQVFKSFQNFGYFQENAKNIVLFLTDGEPTDDPTGDIYPSIANGQQKVNNTVIILTYGLGTGLKDTAKSVLTRISNENNGKFTHIKDGNRDELKSSLGTYYKHFITVGNVALGKTTTQSSLNTASYSVDGYSSKPCARTKYQNNPWWSVDLKKNTEIMAVTVVNCCGETVRNIQILVTNTDQVVENCGESFSIDKQETKTIFCASGVSGRYVKITRSGTSKRLSLCEVKIYKTLAPSNTLSIPCTSANGTMFGVAAVDLSLNKLFSEIISFSFGKYSYGTVIDLSGRVWIHPRAQNPDSSEGASLVLLNTYEPWLSDELFKKIRSQNFGNVSVGEVDIQVARGYSTTDGVMTIKINITVSWKKMSNIFIAILILENKNLLEQQRTEMRKTVETIQVLRSYWNQQRKKDNSSVTARYIVAENGVYSRHSDVTSREKKLYKYSPWYRRAVVDSGVFSLSYSIDDFCARGKLVSLSVASLKNTKQGAKKTNNIVAVSGVDLTLVSLKRIAFNTIPLCLHDYDCYVVDKSGYIFLSLNDNHEVVHVAEKFPWLGKYFFETLQVMKPSWCNDLQNMNIQLYYKLEIQQALFNKTASTCRQYMLLPLQDISSFLLVLPSRRIHKQCDDESSKNSPTGCSCNDKCNVCAFNFSKCQCPCICPMSFDICTNKIGKTFTELICPAQFKTDGNYTTMKDNSTDLPGCRKTCNIALNREQCNQIHNCKWCDNSIVESCESFCPFNQSRPVRLDFKIELRFGNEKLRNETRMSLQENIYKTLGEKLENNIQSVTFLKESVIVRIGGSFVSDIYEKFQEIKKSVKEKTFYITYTNNSRVQKLFPKKMNILNTNECEEDVDNCDDNAMCIDTEDSFMCRCKPGFQGNGTICIDNDECKLQPCSHDGICTNIPGSYLCSCKSGYYYENHECLDIDECASNPCNLNGVCINTPSSFQCSCKKGYFYQDNKCTEFGNKSDDPRALSTTTSAADKEKRTGEYDKILIVIVSLAVVIICCTVCLILYLFKRNRRKRQPSPQRQLVTVRPASSSPHREIKLFKINNKIGSSEENVSHERTSSFKNLSDRPSPSPLFQVVSHVVVKRNFIEV